MADANRPGLVFEATFDTPLSIGGTSWETSGNTTTHAVDIAGRRAQEFKLNHYGDADPMRTELVPQGMNSTDFTNGGQNARIGQTYWYGAKAYMPTSYAEKDSSPEVIMQWHDWPDDGEAWKNPAIALKVLPWSDGGNHLVVKIRADSHSFTPATGYDLDRYDAVDIYDLGKVDSAVGKWTDWVWKIKWGYDSTGSLELWRDGQKVLDLPNKANTFNDQQGPYWKMGVYKWPWADGADTGADTRTIYYDDVRVGNGSATYNTVAPSGSTTTDPTTPPPVVTPPPDSTAGVTLSGTEGDDVLTGGSGADNLRGNGGNDKITGGGGNDFLDGGKGTDAIDGGTGTDTLDLLNATTAFAVDLAARTANGGTGDLDSVINVENVVGTILNDQLRGDDGANMLLGQAGDDIVDGRGGDDVVAGDGGNDMLYGGAGNDMLYGGAGNDRMDGGTGNDILQGGAGADTVVIANLSSGVDRVTDFAAAEDKVDLTGVYNVLKATYGSRLASDYVKFVANGTATEIRIDADGAAGPGAAQTVAILDNTAVSALKIGVNVIAPTTVSTPATVTSDILVTASGSVVNGVGAHFKMMVDGRQIGEATAGTTTSTYAFKTGLTADLAHKVQIQFDNDLYLNGQDRNLHVSKIAINGKVVDPSASIVTYDKGALDGADVVPGQGTMPWNGTLVVAAPKEYFPATAAGALAATGKAGDTGHAGKGTLHSDAGHRDAGQTDAKAGETALHDYIAFLQTVGKAHGQGGDDYGHGSNDGHGHGHDGAGAMGWNAAFAHDGTHHGTATDDHVDGHDHAMLHHSLDMAA